jgi:hypothetical protein
MCPALQSDLKEQVALLLPLAELGHASNHVNSSDIVVLTWFVAVLTGMSEGSKKRPLAEAALDHKPKKPKLHDVLIVAGMYELLYYTRIGGKHIIILPACRCILFFVFLLPFGKQEGTSLSANEFLIRSNQLQMLLHWINFPVKC